jgi:soluble lytic murein transglycosylase-like protein
MRKTLSLFIAFIILIVAAIAVYLAVPMIFGSVVTPLPDEYRRTITDYAKKYKVDSCLIAGVINGESRWNPSATSHAGAQGLMQLMPSTADGIAKREGLPYTRNNRKQPEASIAMGTALLKYNITTYGSLRNALVAYNAGGSRAGRPDNQLPRETQNYIVKISRYYSLYASTYPDFCTGPSLIGKPITNKADTPDFVSPPEEEPTDLRIENFWKAFLTP